MANEKEYTSSTRTLRILKAIIQSGKIYTKKQLADRYGVSVDTIDDDFRAIRNVGFELLYDERYRYYIELDKSYEYLKSLLVFSPKEENLIIEGLQNITHDSATAERLMRKISRIYDVSKMHNTFDKGFLTKMDKLQKAMKDEKVVILKDYHSTNSSSVSNRTVEVFHVSAEEDIVHAYDLDKQGIRHFRISRVTQLEILPTDWSCKGHHSIVATDPFRIQENNQVKIHLRLKVGAYNELIEHFPLTRGHLRPAPEGEGIYDLECKVNYRFFGLSNFIIGNYRNVIAILEPEILIDHIAAEAQKLLDKNF